MENLIVIILFIVGTILYNAIKGRSEADESMDKNEAPPPPRPNRPSVPSPPRPSPAAHWEEELRRLLQGERPEDRPMPEPAPLNPPSAPPPLPSAARPVRFPRPAAPPPILARSNIPVPDEGMEMNVGLPVPPVTLRQAASAHERARVQDSVTERMKATTTRVTTHAGLVAHVAQLDHPTRMRSMLHHRESVRLAVMASVLLGPPRALDPLG